MDKGLFHQLCYCHLKFKKNKLKIKKSIKKWAKEHNSYFIKDGGITPMIIFKNPNDKVEFRLKWD